MAAPGTLKVGLDPSKLANLTMLPHGVRKTLATTSETWYDLV